MMLSNNNREENPTTGRKAEFAYIVSDIKKPNQNNWTLNKFSILSFSNIECVTEGFIMSVIAVV